MTFASFFRLLQEELLRNLPANADIEIIEAAGGLNRITVHTPADLISPVIALDRFYSAYLDGLTMAEIADRILSVYSAETLHPLYTAEDFPDRKTFLKGLRLRPASLQQNKRIVQTLPHIIRYNVLFYLTVSLPGAAALPGESPVTNEHLRHYRTKLMSACSAALENMQAENEPVIMPIDAFIETISDIKYEIKHPYSEGMTRKKNLYVLTNKTYDYGACTLLRKNVPRDLYDSFGEYYLLPSSVHELLILPKKDAGNELRLRSFIRSANQKMNDSLMVLSDDLYAYDPESGIYIC